MKFLIKQSIGGRPEVVDFAEDEKTKGDMILNICNEDKILSIIDEVKVYDQQDGIHLLKILKDEYVKVKIFTNAGYVYNSKDFELSDRYYISDYTPVKEKKDMMEKLVKELNLTRKPTAPISK